MPDDREHCYSSKKQFSRFFNIRFIFYFSANRVPVFPVGERNGAIPESLSAYLTVLTTLMIVARGYSQSYRLRRPTAVSTVLAVAEGTVTNRLEELLYPRERCLRQASKSIFCFM